jgi:hypothetical protein
VPFPARAAGYTKVGQSGGPHCTGSGTAGPDLTALIEWSDGRGTGRQSLVGRLQPLMAEVTEAAAGHDRG